MSPRSIRDHYQLWQKSQFFSLIGKIEIAPNVPELPVIDMNDFSSKSFRIFSVKGNSSFFQIA